MFGKRQERVLGGSKVRFGPSSILGTPSIPRGQCAPGLSRCTSQGAGFWRGHLVLHPFPDWGEGRPGRGEKHGGRRQARRRWAAARDELSPAGCCPQVASDAAPGPRPRHQPPGAFRASLPIRAGPGLVGPGRRLRKRRAPPRPPPPIPPSESPRPPYLHLRPARPPPGGLHSERPRAARPDPTQASQPARRRGGATVTKPAASARSATAATTGFPPPRRVRALPPPP
ncbi:hypothetical protein ACRRTK_000468 [Alexandromys fortis]